MSNNNNNKEMNNKIDLDFLPDIMKLDYELIKTNGKLDGTRYKLTKRIKRHSGSNKNK